MFDTAEPKEASKGNDDLMEKLKVLLEGPKKESTPASQLVLPDYVHLWKRSLGEAVKIMDLYGKWDKAPFTKGDCARMIFSDVLERQRRNDFPITK